MRFVLNILIWVALTFCVIAFLRAPSEELFNDSLWYWSTLFSTLVSGFVVVMPNFWHTEDGVLGRVQGCCFYVYHLPCPVPYPIHHPHQRYRPQYLAYDLA